MDTRKIGSLTVSVVGLGCNNFGRTVGREETGVVVGSALDAGITLFDTADIYGETKSEEYLGAALGSRRDEIVLATKFGLPYEGHVGGAAPDAIRAALDASLRRLGTDHIDLYQQHRPDPNTPIAETLGTLSDLVAEGKVREFGCSNFDGPLLEEARAAATNGASEFISVQNHYNILRRDPEDEVLPFCDATGTAFLPFYPLASGVLSGKYKPGQAAPEGTRMASFGERANKELSDQRLATVRALNALALTEGHTVLDLAFAWLLSHPAVASVIAGATKPEQIAANAAAGQWSPGAALLTQVDTIAPRQIRPVSI